MEPILFENIRTYFLELTTQDVSSIISTVANVIMAIGVGLAAKSLRIQKNVHLVDTHLRFQSEMRRLQEKMHHDVNENRIVFTQEEKRIVRLYWYAVVDEWFTCQVRSHDKQINQLWESFAWGAKSAIEHLPLFASELIALKSKKPYLLGTHAKFFDEIETFSRTCASPLYPAPQGKRKCVFLFGAPCSGKSSITDELIACGWTAMKIDEIIVGIDPSPKKKSFSDFGEAVCLAVYGEHIKANVNSFTVVELGCLFPKNWVFHLQSMLALLSIEVVHFVVNVPEDVARLRAEARNIQIDNGDSSAIKIDDPNKIYEFFDELNKNIPDEAIPINAEVSDSITLARQIVNHCQSERSIN